MQRKRVSSARHLKRVVGDIVFTNFSSRKERYELKYLMILNIKLCSRPHILIISCEIRPKFNWGGWKSGPRHDPDYAKI